MEVLWLCVKLQSLVFFDFATQFELDFKSISKHSIILVFELATSSAIIILVEKSKINQTFCDVWVITILTYYYADKL